MKYRITSTASVDFGLYEGADEKEAFLAMLRETGDEGQYGEPHIGTEADWIITDAQVEYQRAADEYGEITHSGKAYALLDQVELTNRAFNGWWGDAAEGEEYISEWSTPAIDQDGEEYVVRWQFTAIKGQEPEDDGDWPWDDEHVTDVQVV